MDEDPNSVCTLVYQQMGRRCPTRPPDRDLFVGINPLNDQLVHHQWPAARLTRPACHAVMPCLLMRSCTCDRTRHTTVFFPFPTTPPPPPLSKSGFTRMRGCVRRWLPG